jgi:antitoxin (DNA-binding transcriptional repressor) of toxin-antitoxin stability system
MTNQLYSTTILGYNLPISQEAAMTTKSIEIHEAQQQLAELVAQAATGTEIILLDGQTPRARLVPITPQAVQRIPGLHAGSITMAPDFDQPLPDDFWIGTP